MDTKTICQVGCLMSCTAMGLSGASINISNATSADPASLNSWLRSHGGYDGSNDLFEEVVPQIDPSRVSWPPDGMHRTNDLAFDEACDFVRGGRVVVANVRDGGHFVLITGCGGDGDTFSVNDPGFMVDEYSFKDDVVGYRIYDMLRPPAGGDIK